MRGIPDLLLFFLVLVWVGIANAQEPIRIGSLHSLTGTMAISESGLRNALLMQAEQENQQALPAVDYLIEQHGIQRWVLAGTDYLHPRTINELLAAYLESKGFATDNIMLSYTPFGHTDWRRIVRDIKQFGSQGRKTAVVSTVNGDANVALYRELAAQGITASTLPVMAFSMGEAELQAGTTDPEGVRNTMIGMEVANLSGGSATLQPNHHLSKPVYIGEIRPDGQYNVIWHSAANVDGKPWFDPTSDNKAQ